MTTGGLNRLLAQLSHSQICRSVPQTPAWWTRISTSLGPQGGTGTFWRAIPGPGAGLTRARIEPRNEVGRNIGTGGRRGKREPRIADRLVSTQSAASPNGVSQLRCAVRAVLAAYHR